MSWAGYERALPPEMIPHRLFDRLFGAREEGWVNRKRSILDAIRAGCDRAQEKAAAPTIRLAWTSILSGIRDLERSIAGLPPEYRARRSARFRRRHEGLAAHREIAERSAGAGAGDAADARRVLYVDEVPEPVAIPVARLHLGAASRLHARRRTRRPARTESEGQRVLRDICRWHVEEFAYLVAKLNRFRKATARCSTTAA